MLVLSAAAVALCPQTTHNSAVSHSGIAQMQTTGPVAQYLFDEGSGRFAANSFKPTSPLGTSLVGLPQQSFAFIPWGLANDVVTDNYASAPDGYMTASRVYSAAGGAYVYSTLQKYTVGQTYTLSAWMKSNTGSSQTVTMRNCGQTSSSKTVTTTWAQFSFTCTAGGATDQMGPVYNSLAAGGDILLWGAQLDNGSSVLTTITQNGQLLANTGNLGNNADFNWQPFGVRLNGTSQWFSGAFGYSPVLFPSTTIYIALRKVGAWGTFNYLISPLLYANLNDFSVSTGSTGTLAFQFNSNTVSSPLDVFNDGYWHILVCEYDGVNLVNYVDYNRLTTPITLSLAPKSVTGFAVASYLRNYFWPGDLGYMGVYSAAHTDAQRNANIDSIRALMTARGETMISTSVNPYIVFEGSTFTQRVQTPYTVGYVYKVSHDLSTGNYMEPGWVAGGGSLLANVAARATIIDAAFAASKATRKIETLWIGEDDCGNYTTLSAAQAYVASIKSYALARKAATPGMKFVILTLVARTGVCGGPGYRDDVNTTIRADSSWYDAIADVGAATHLGALDSDYSNTTYFTDGIHPDTAAAHAIITTIVETAINGLTWP